MPDTSDLIDEFQRAAQHAVRLQQVLWVKVYLDEKTGLVRRGQEIIDMIKSQHGRKFLYTLPDGRTCDSVRKLFNHQGQPGLMCQSIDYTTFMLNAKVYKLKKLDKGVFDDLISGRMPLTQKEAIAYVNRLEAKKRKGDNEVEEEGTRKRPRPLTDLIVELLEAIGCKDVDVRDLKTRTGQDRLLERMNK